MKKLIGIGLVVAILLAGGYWYFADKGPNLADMSGGQPAINPNPIKPNQNTNGSATDQPQKPVKVGGYEIYKAQKETTFDKLDPREKQAVRFIAEIFNGSTEESKGDLITRIRPFLHEQAVGLESIMGKDRFPVEGKRELKKIYLLPEYYSKEKVIMHVIPMQIIYKLNGEELQQVIYLSIMGENGGSEWVAGHVDGYEWFVDEVVKKHNLKF